MNNARLSKKLFKEKNNSKIGEEYEKKILSISAILYEKICLID